MLWFRAPEKVYIKKGCLPVALDELGCVLGKKKAFIVTDSFLYNNGYTLYVLSNCAKSAITCSVSRPSERVCAPYFVKPSATFCTLTPDF